MDEITTSSPDILTLCREALGEQGKLAAHIPGFKPRQQQLELACAIIAAITDKTLLVAEAGTGTGKTYAYLIPCLLSGKKALISTATKTLQDQLFHKDLPILLKVFGLSTQVQNLKGRSTYLCRYRLELHAKETYFATAQIAHDIAYIRDKFPQLIKGERGELPEIKEDSLVWPYVTSTVDNCLGNECEHQQNCFLMNARKRALAADIVVINHHLYFADSSLKQDGFAELLPGVDVVIFDEAHQLADIAANFQGQRLGTRQLRELLDDILREWPVLDLVNQPLKELSFELDLIITQLLSVLSTREERLGFEQVVSNPQFKTAWDSLSVLMNALLECFADLTFEESPGLRRCMGRLQELHRLTQLLTTSDATQIRWIERFKQNIVFHSTPFDIADTFNSTLKQHTAAYIFASATLTIAGSFLPFTRSLGLEQADTLLLPSPFHFQQQALMYLPRSLPDPKDERYYSVLIAKVLPLINACGGRCFFLFTSHRALQLVATLIKPYLNFPLLVQGDEAKPILLARFRELGNAVLLGTATFWEGVDVKGEALSCVIIDKLPFASPMDPLVRGKIAYFKARGLSGFDQVSLPSAVMALKQGVGRLIRDTNDRGVLVIADPRLVAREYGQEILASLPKMMRTRDEKKVLSFINQLALTNESASN
ncbi:MAG: ATP-dependent DNA helicase [Legionella sp.]